MRTFLNWLNENARNSLQSPAMSMHPEITKTLAGLQALPGVRVLRMSGSGATCYALFDTMEAAESAAAQLKTQQPDWWVRATLLGDT